MRKLAREAVFKVIYKSFFLNDDLSCEEVLEIDSIFDSQDIEFVNNIVSLYKQNMLEINESINSYLVGYSPERVYKIDRAILCLAVTEIKYYKQTPVKIVINEAVELAKKYSTEKSYSFVNGILKNIVGEINGN